MKEKKLPTRLTYISKAPRVHGKNTSLTQAKTLGLGLGILLALGFALSVAFLIGSLR